MHWSNLMVLTLAFFLHAPYSTAGGMSTGGGSAVICRDQNNKVDKAFLLDLFEGRERFGYTIPNHSSSIDEQLNDALQRISAAPAIFSVLKKVLANTYNNYVFLPAHLALHTSSDLGTEYAVVVLDGCGLEQLGYYESDGKLKVVSSIFHKLSSTDQAAFFMHEALYRLTRGVAGAFDSSSARKLTAQMFSSTVDDNQLIADFKKIFQKIEPTIFLNVEPSKKFTIKFEGIGEWRWDLHLFDLDGRRITEVNDPLILQISSPGASSGTIDFRADNIFRIEQSGYQGSGASSRFTKITVFYDGSKVYESSPSPR
jgi:hypothetical protein